MWIIIAAIIILVIFADSDTKPSTTKKRNTHAAPPLHCTVHRTGHYSSILNELEQIVFLIAKRCPWMKLQVLVMVRKINVSTCSVSFQIEDVYLKKNNSAANFRTEGMVPMNVCILKQSRQQASKHLNTSKQNCFVSLTGHRFQPILHS